MLPSVRSGWIAFNEQFEGRTPYMYCDIKGLVTTGVGDLIDPMDLALSLPWVDVLTGTPASQGDIIAEWDTVKKLGPAHDRGPLSFWKNRAQLVLKDADIDAMIMKKVDELEAQLKRRPPFKRFDSWPAPSQTALLSMAWAMGAGFNFPKFEGASAHEDWLTAAKECRMDDSHNPGLRPRNAAMEKLFRAAAAAPGGALS